MRAALLRWKVIFFRDQHIGPAEHIAFGRQFGVVTPAHPILPSIEGYPEVLPLSSEAYASQDPAAEIDSELLAQFLKAARRSVHPVVRVHPETGERALFVNPFFTESIVGLTGSESHRVLHLLYEQMLKPDYIVRFRWAPGSIAFWDNRATAHIVPTDIPKGMHRCHERITIAGDIPVDPAGNKSYVLEPDV